LGYCCSTAAGGSAEAAEDPASPVSGSTVEAAAYPVSPRGADSPPDRQDPAALRLAASRTAPAADPRRIGSFSTLAPESTPVSAPVLSFCDSPSEVAAEPPEPPFCTEILALYSCHLLLMNHGTHKVIRIIRVSNIRQFLANTIVSPVIRAKEMFWQQGNFLPETCTSIFMERGKRENIFIKDYISRYVYPPCSYVKALISLMKRTIPKKGTLLRSKL
jgi:hypothetical protein